MHTSRQSARALLLAAALGAFSCAAGSFHFCMLTVLAEKQSVYFVLVESVKNTQVLPEFNLITY